jgi:hypothetical protein
MVMWKRYHEKYQSWRSYSRSLEISRKVDYMCAGNVRRVSLSLWASTEAIYMK